MLRLYSWFLEYKTFLLQHTLSQLNQTLPVLKSNRDLPALSATMPAPKLQPELKQNGHALNRTMVPSIGSLPNGLCTAEVEFTTKMFFEINTKVWLNPLDHFYFWKIWRTFTHRGNFHWIFPSYSILPDNLPVMIFRSIHTTFMFKYRLKRIQTSNKESDIQVKGSRCFKIYWISIPLLHQKLKLPKLAQ